MGPTVLLDSCLSQEGNVGFYYMIFFSCFSN